MMLNTASPSCYSSKVQHLSKSRGKLPASSRLLRPKGKAREKKKFFGVTSSILDKSSLPLSGLQGKAIVFPPKDEFPSRSEVLSNIPDECFKKDTMKSLAYTVLSTVLTAFCGALAFAFIPLKLCWLPVWLSYAAVTGTIATGCWVIAHECGHNAFSENRILQDFVGYSLHSLLLVPYFSWQRSHAVHHSRTNHLTEGETHVPYVKGEVKGDLNLNARKGLGEGLFTFIQLLTHLVFGWPAYLITGATGGSARGITNHFLPWINTGELELFPGSWKKKVLVSDAVSYTHLTLPTKA